MLAGLPRLHARGGRHRPVTRVEAWDFLIEPSSYQNMYLLALPLRVVSVSHRQTVGKGNEGNVGHFMDERLDDGRLVESPGATITEKSMAKKSFSFLLHCLLLMIKRSIVCSAWRAGTIFGDPALAPRCSTPRDLVKLNEKILKLRQETFRL